MNILNKEELRKQIREGKEISLDGILDEFKSLLRESLQTASEEELTSTTQYPSIALVFDCFFHLMASMVM